MKKQTFHFVGCLVAALLLTDCSDDTTQPQPEICPPAGEVAVSLTTAVQTFYEVGPAEDAFGMMLATGETLFDEEEGLYRTAQEGYTMILCLHAAPAADTSAPQLPAGNYALAAEAAPGVWDADAEICSLVGYAPGKGVETIVPCAGEVSVSVANGIYELAARFTDENGTLYEANYAGALSFQGIAPGGSVLYRPVDTEFIGGQALYFGADESFPEYGSVKIEMWDDENDPLAGSILGNFVKLKLYFDLPAEGFSGVPVGTYTIDPRTVGSFFAEAGRDNGIDIPTGCYIAQTQKSGVLFGMLSSGTVEISAEGYVTLDALTDEGVSVRGRLRVPLEVQDFTGGTPVDPSGPVSTLTEDVAIDLSGASEADFLDYGDYFENGTRNVVLTILDERNLTYMAVDLVLPAADRWAPIPDCTCTIGDDSYTAGTFLPGALLFGSPVGTYYCTLEPTEGGTYAIGDLLGPAAWGTVEIVRGEGDVYTLTFDLQDDTPLAAHAIRGSWSGTLTPLSYGATTGRTLHPGW